LVIKILNPYPDSFEMLDPVPDPYPDLDSMNSGSTALVKSIILFASLFESSDAMFCTTEYTE
jgi:hypothetical protein